MELMCEELINKEVPVEDEDSGLALASHIEHSINNFHLLSGLCNIRLIFLHVLLKTVIVKCRLYSNNPVACADTGTLTHVTSRYGNSNNNR